MSTSSLRFFVLLLAVVALPCAVEAGNTKGAKSPEITISDGINGVTKKTTIASLKGSPVLVVLWLPTCPHCQKFMPSVHKFHKTYGPKGLKIVTVSIGKKDYTAGYLKRNGWTFGVGFDWTGKTSRAFKFTATPGIALVGADGHLRKYTGTLEDAIKAELPTPK